MKGASVLDLALDRMELTELEEQLLDVNLRLAKEAKVGKDVSDLIGELTLQVSEIPAVANTRIDPYLMLALQQGVISSLRALALKDRSEKRRQLRVALELMRQALRDVTEGIFVSEERSTKEILRWLVDTLDVPQAEVAEVLSVQPRKFQRWLSPKDPAEPHDEDALRVKILARITNHLRHGFSGPGVLAWLERPHPELKGNSPSDLLDKRQTFEQLLELAAAARSSSAS